MSIYTHYPMKPPLGREKAKKRREPREWSMTARVALVMVAGLIVGFVSGVVVAHAEPMTMYVCTEKDPLNVRVAPDISERVIARMEKGWAVTVLEVRKGWALLEGVGEEGRGWAKAEYLGEAVPEGADWLEVEPE